MNFGDMVREKRLELGMSLREFSSEIEMDPANLSRIERGIKAPPVGSAKLQVFAEKLDIPVPSQEWDSFSDQACTAAGRISSSITNSERVELIPAFFRTIRNTKLSNEEIL